MVQPWNLGPGLVDFSALGNLGKTFQTSYDDTRKKTALADLGKDLQAGNYDGAAHKAFAAGDASTGLGIMKLSQTAKEKGLATSATRGLVEALGGSGAGLPTTPSVGPVGAASPASLIQTESGGRWDAQNDAVGAGGKVGHFGRLQFGQARLQEAAAAGAIPPGTTAQAFMASPELQQRAEAWHFKDIESYIGQNGLDRAVGQTIGGVPVTVEGMKYAAHLGGKDGMKRFIESGGSYNPADRNGTRLSDYLAKGAQASGARTAQADMPAPGARTASMETGAEGFNIPQAAPAPMAGRTFDAISNADRLEPAFQAEGVSQSWMGTALRPPQGEAVARAAPMPPRRPADLGADLPAPGAVPAVGQMPQPVPPDLSNTPDGGAKNFAMMQGRNAPPSMVTAGQVAPGASVPTPSAAVRQAPPVAAPAQPALGASPADRPAPGAVPAEGPAPVLSSEMPRPSTAAEAQEFRQTRLMEAERGKVTKLAAALANPHLPANARAVGEIFLKEALENSKAPDSVKEYMYAKAMGWTKAGSPAEYAKEKTKTSPAEETEGRKAAAAAAGLKSSDPGYQSFILTGKMPREDQAPLTATDKKAILEADDMVLTNRSAIDNLRQAKELSAKSYEGITAGIRGKVTGNFGSEAGQATMEYDNLVSTNALGQLKAIFGAAPTEGERKILLEIQGSASLPHNLRVKILDRGIAMAEKKLAFNEQRATELRGGDYYKPPEKRGQQGRTAAPEASQPRQSIAAPAAAVEFLRANPGARAQFDAKYGAGASASILGQ